MASRVSGHVCTYCQSKLEKIAFSCATCSICKSKLKKPSEPQLYFCTFCFSCGVEIGSHKKEHDYNIISDDDRCPVFVASRGDPWTASEEFKLLDAVQSAGFGNWAKVAALVEKPAHICEEHYNGYYISGTIGSTLLGNKTALDDRSDCHLTDHTPTAVDPPVISEDDTDDAENYFKTLGYMPLRDDYILEYDAKAEATIAAVRLRHDDEDIDISVRCEEVDMYRRRLIDRQTRKLVAREFGLVRALLHQTPASFPTLGTSSLSSEQCALSQFMPADQMAQLSDNMRKERILRSKIRDLQRHRRAGYRSFADVRAAAEASGKERPAGKAAANAKKKTGSSSSFQAKRGKRGRGSKHL